MALGKRQVCDLMAEIGLHLLEPLTLQTLASPVNAGSAVTITLDPSSPRTFPYAPQFPTTYLYPGAQVVLGWHGDDAEAVTVIEVLNGTQFIANVVNSHVAGETLFGATFPTQQPTDPIFTQDEVIGYIAQAQNEFLAKVPLIFGFFPNNLVNLGQTYQTVPGTAIELERVAVQSTPVAFDIASISRSANTVTCVLSTTANADSWTPQLAILVQGVTDNSFNSANNATFTLATVSADGLTLTWSQTVADASSSGGQVLRPVQTRLYESSQEQIAMKDPWWFSQGGQPPTNWYQDRTGVYGYGLAPPPQGNYYMELLCSTRASETLGLLDYFAIPDIFLIYPKYKVLQWCWEKDGVQRSPSLARFCQGRFDFGVMLADRFLRSVVEKIGPMGAAMGGNF